MLNTSNSSITTNTSVIDVLTEISERLNLSPEDAYNYIDDKIAILESGNYIATLDSAFKKIFSSGDAKIVEDLINTVLKQHNLNHKKVEIVSAESVERVVYKPTKLSRFDVLATDSQGNTYNIEMQRKPHQGFFKRLLYYSALEFTRHLEKGKHYFSVPSHTIIVISLTPWIQESTSNFDNIGLFSRYHEIDVVDLKALSMYNVVVRNGTLEDNTLSVNLKEWIQFFIDGKVQDTENENIIKATESLAEFLNSKDSLLKKYIDERSSVQSVLDEFKKLAKKNHNLKEENIVMKQENIVMKQEKMMIKELMFTQEADLIEFINKYQLNVDLSGCNGVDEKKMAIMNSFVAND